MLLLRSLYGKRRWEMKFLGSAREKARKGVPNEDSRLRKVRDVKE